MNNAELIAELQKHPKDLPIWMKVDQEITGCDSYAWMRGEASKVYQEKLYLDPQQGDDGAYTNRDSLDDRIDFDPAEYLGEEILNATDDWYDFKKQEFFDSLPWETVVVIEVKP